MGIAFAREASENDAVEETAGVQAPVEGSPEELLPEETVEDGDVRETEAESAVLISAEDPAEYILTVVVDPEGSGSVTGEGAYLSGAEAVLTALPEDGYVFSRWMDADAQEVLGGQSELRLTVEENLTVRAVFEAAAPQTIEEASLEYSAPRDNDVQAAGENWAVTDLSGGQSYTVDRAYWQEEGASSEADLTFRAGGRYYLTVCLAPAEGRVFDAELTNAYLNGQTCAAGLSEDGTLEIRSDVYTVPPQAPVTEAANASDGIRLTWGAVGGAARYVIHSRTAGGSWRYTNYGRMN